MTRLPIDLKLKYLPALLLAGLLFLGPAAGAAQSASTVLLGDTSLRSTSDSNPAGLAEAFQFTALASGSANKLYLYLDSGSASTALVIGLYANGANNNPAGLLAQASLANPGAGIWVSAAVTPVSLTKGSLYWIAVLGASGKGVVRFRDACCGRAQTSSANNLSALPAAWSAGNTYTDSPISAYAVQETTAGTSTPTSSPTPIPPTSTPTLTPTRTPTALSTFTPTFTPLPATFTPTATVILPTFTPTPTSGPSSTPTSAAPLAFAIGPGSVDVIPHQIVRAGDDRLYLFASKGTQSSTIKSYWSANPGLPNGPADFQAGPELLEPAVVISVDTAYDGLNTIHVFTNLANGTLRDHPFDIPSRTFRAVTILAPNSPLGSPASAATSTDIGTSGISSIVGPSGLLHLLYWSSGNQITYLALNYNAAANSFTQAGAPTRVDTLGTDNNHPVAALSPLDGSLTVAWVSGSNGAGKIYTRSRSAAGVWDAPQLVSAADAWTSSVSGLNIDQGPSLLIDSAGVRHLAYIENWRVSAPYDYGRVHYVRNAGAGWVDQYTGFYTHDPALALDSTGGLLILGHGYPLNPSCLSVDEMCVSQRAADGSWAAPQLLFSPPSGLSFDASVSLRWSVVGWNRPETVEFLFFSAPYDSPTLYYGRLGSVPSGPTPTPTLQLPTATPTSTSTPTVLPPTSTPTSTPTALPPTATPTSTPTALSPTSTPTSTPTGLPSTPTPTRTPTAQPATSTPTSTPTGLPPTPTPTRTPTAQPPTSTPTSTPLPPTATPTLAAGGFPVSPVLDTFNRANGSLGANWSGAAGGYTVASNQMDVGFGDAIFWAPASFGANQEVFVTFNSPDPAGVDQDLLLKSQSSQTWGSGVIEVYYEASTHRAQVWTYTSAQNWVQRGADIPVTFATGDQFGARARSNGTLEVYRNGLLLAARDISAWPYNAGGGYIGLWFSSASNALLDNFGGGTLP